MKNREEKVLKNREEKKKKGSYVGGGDNPAHKVYNVVCFIMLCYNNREKGIESRGKCLIPRLILILFIIVVGYLACQGFNQLGSLVYYYTLTLAPLSLVVPAVNTGKILFNILGN